jgi:hypothetical protein
VSVGGLVDEHVTELRVGVALRFFTSCGPCGVNRAARPLAFVLEEQAVPSSSMALQPRANQSATSGSALLMYSPNRISLSAAPNQRSTTSDRSADTRPRASSVRNPCSTLSSSNRISRLREKSSAVRSATLRSSFSLWDACSVIERNTWATVDSRCRNASGPWHVGLGDLSHIPVAPNPLRQFGGRLPPGAACETTLRGSAWSAPLDREGRAVSTVINYTCRFDVE